MLKERDVIVGNKGISMGGPAFFIAEITYSHSDCMSEAYRLVDAASECGADSVKIRTSRSGREVPADSAQSGRESRPNDQRLARKDMDCDQLVKLKAYAVTRGILLIAVPCDEESTDFLTELDVAAFQIASRDLTHLPLLRHVASKAKPIILATGMSFLNEVAEAILTLKSAGAKGIVLMHSVSCHPAEPESLNLRSITTLRQQFELPVGYADHCEGTLFAVAAAVLGASVIEKPMTLDSGSKLTPWRVAASPAEMRQLIQSVRAVEMSLGDGRKRPSAPEVSMRAKERRSIVAAVDIRAHESIARWMLSCERPGSGLEPRKLDKLIGMRARRDIAKGTPLRWEDLSASARWSLDARSDPAETAIENASGWVADTKS